MHSNPSSKRPRENRDIPRAQTCNKQIFHVGRAQHQQSVCALYLVNEKKLSHSKSHKIHRTWHDVHQEPVCMLGTQGFTCVTESSPLQDEDNSHMCSLAV